MKIKYNFIKVFITWCTTWPSCLTMCLVWFICEKEAITPVSQIDVPVRLFFPRLFPSLYVLFGSICLMVSQKNCFSVCFLGAFSLQNYKNVSKKPVNNNFGPVCLIYSEKNSALYLYSGLYAYNFLRKFPSCMLTYSRH